ncbi:hypothetical protein ABO04_04520 [Nitrosomonas sp. HPC101]|uniref:hypothetical protein n=1 Tax=Nitrosomonas sp. HPC101 TaxID=1658667 RepID=UPI00136ADB0A|nr:hypothetical protein [Nitrosomonas sp. HPC101]MXS85197.1 hypothetical protein [Nitrosomonas sp. HPC101]
MKKTYLLSAALLMFLSSSVIAEETLTEKLETKTNDAERATNKAINRVQEATCTDSDVECLKQKAENRASEAYDATKDKASEIKNKVDW